MATIIDEKERSRALSATLGQLEKQFGIYDISQFTPSVPPAK